MTPGQIMVDQLDILNFAFAYIDTDVSCLPNAASPNSFISGLPPYIFFITLQFDVHYGHPHQQPISI
jgi:hypothetical protein